ncbi:MAG: WD40 repeat domain-containing protein [Planctomycetota bacterium]|jgi:WD40 repeat protein
MALNLSLIVTIFLTRDRWAAWVPDGQFGTKGRYPWTVASGGTRVILFTQMGDAELWDVDARKRIAVLPGCGEPRDRTVRFSPDGTRCLITSIHDSPGYSKVTPPLLLNSDTGARVGDFGELGAPLVACFSPDGSRLFMAFDDGTARVWDARTGATVADLAAPPVRKSWVDPSPGIALSPPADWVDTTPKRRGCRVHCADFSPDGQRLLIDDNMSNVREYDASTGRELRWYRSREIVAWERDNGPKEYVAWHAERPTWEVRYSKSGRRILVVRVGVHLSDHDMLEVFDGANGTHLRTIEGSNFVISPDGASIASGGMDWKGAFLHDAETGEVLLEQTGGSHHSAEFLVGGKVVFFASRDSLIMANALTGRSLPCEPISNLGATLIEETNILAEADCEDSLLRFKDWRMGDLLTSIYGIDSFVLLQDDLLLASSSSEKESFLLRRIRPEWWWGVFWLPHLYLIAALAAALLLSGWRDLKRLRKL